MNPENKNSKIKKFLKNKDEINIIKDKKKTEEFIKRKLVEEPKDYFKKKLTFSQRFSNILINTKKRLFFFRTSQFKKFRIESFPIYAFTIFSCYIMWKMTEDYDNMQRKNLVNKSLKQIEIEREENVLFFFNLWFSFY